jgi:hypothetical protein
MRTAAPIAAILVLLAPASGHAFDATQADIIGLRLGMTDTDVTAAMQRQGFAVTYDRSAIAARTKDGRLTVDFTDDRVVRQIRYTLDAKGAAATESIRASVLDRFGPPDQAQPMGWCRTPGRDGMCPQTAAALTFQADTHTLMLRDGTSRDD